MKRIVVTICTIMFFVSCNNADKTSAENTKDSANKSNVSLPYTLNQQIDWEWGDQNNVVIAMNALRGFETGEIDNTRQYFSDSVEFRGDYWHYQGSADSLMNEFKKYRKNYTNYSVTMDDYESVKNKVNGDEYVSLWYHEKFTDTKGKSDSIYVMDDIKILNGKIASIDSKVRHYPAIK